MCSTVEVNRPIWKEMRWETVLLSSSLSLCPPAFYTEDETTPLCRQGEYVWRVWAVRGLWLYLLRFGDSVKISFDRAVFSFLTRRPYHRISKPQLGLISRSQDRIDLMIRCVAYILPLKFVEDSQTVNSFWYARDIYFSRKFVVIVNTTASTAVVLASRCHRDCDRIR